MIWSDELKTLDFVAGTELINKFNETLELMKGHGEEALREQADKVARYLQQLINKEITPKQLQLYLDDVKDILVAEAAKEAVVAKVETKALFEQIINVLVSFLTNVIGRLVSE